MARHGAKHRHLLKKKTKKEPKEALDYIVYFFGIATPLFEIPQAVQIFTTKSAESVSLWTWGFFLIDNLVWIVYAIRHRLWPLLVTSILYEVVEGAIVVGVLIYR